MLLAVAKNGEVGIDLEQVRTGVDVLKLAGRFYSASEHGLINGLPPEEQARQFFRHWVAKEAVLKGQGVGLRSLSECEVVPLDHGQRATTRVAAGSTVQPDWNIQWLSCGEGWEGAVAFRGDCIVRHM
jgi:4'-phosphopantetheinyl transferase